LPLDGGPEDLLGLDELRVLLSTILVVILPQPI
jgi:hypothetical protein